MRIQAAERLANKENVYSKESLNDRLNWKIVKKSQWVATYLPTNEHVFGRTKEQLMSKINQFTKDKQQ